MISTKDATQIILATRFRPAIEKVPLAASVGRVLREQVVADRDFPPFDRVMMDGICINYGYWENGQRKFLVAGTQIAGMPAMALTDPTACLEVMTGAMLPQGADTVIRYEDLQFEQADGQKFAIIAAEGLAKGENVHHQGSDRGQGSVLLPPGRLIGPAEIAVMAAVGHSHPLVSQKIRVAIVSTGDELVPVDQTPQLHQIRQSNLQALAAALTLLPVHANTFHLLDEKAVLAEKLEAILAQHDVLILSGGVSKGKADFVPEVLEGLGVEKKFHRVAQRPGKPFWFGAVSHEKTVFALPGNPVSTFMCFHRYVKPWLQQASGLSLTLPMKAVLQEDVTFKPPLSLFLQVRTGYNEAGQFIATPIPGKGSGDFANLLDADAFLELPAGRDVYRKGEVFDLWQYR